MQLRENLTSPQYPQIPRRWLELTSYKTSNGISGSLESFPFLCLVAFFGASLVVLLRFEGARTTPAPFG